MRNLIVNTVLVLWIVFVTIFSGFAALRLATIQGELKQDFTFFTDGFVKRYSSDMKKVETFANKLRADYPSPTQQEVTK